MSLYDWAWERKREKLVPAEAKEEVWALAGDPSPAHVHAGKAAGDVAIEGPRLIAVMPSTLGLARKRSSYLSLCSRFAGL
ncbi:uncharacterized protein VTP21DRAFT_691 [Calcarisporiella thermophila]|uniref:uncharacterized protein n=1 Tax=Calcarisporiella thermophila TaxID=911321 RepID=UPI0037434AC8